MRDCTYTLLLALFVLLLCGTGATSQAATSTMSVSAVVLSKSNCKFNNPGTATLNFGNLNPLTPVDVNANTSLSFTCRGSEPIATFLITDDDGLHETGVNASRMQHSVDASAFLPYSFTLSPTSASVPRNVSQTLTVTGTVFGADYQSALLGAYTDQVIITIQP